MPEISLDSKCDNATYRVSQNLMKLMKDNRMSFRSLAAAAGISPATLNRIIKHNGKPQPRTLEVLCKVLRVSPNELLFSVNPRSAQTLSVQNQSGILQTGPINSLVNMPVQHNHREAAEPSSRAEPEALPMSRIRGVFTPDSPPLSVVIETDSMSPTICDGDVVRFDPSCRPKTGAIVLAEADERILLGRFARNLDSLFVTFDNPDYGSDRTPVSRILATAVTLIREL